MQTAKANPMQIPFCCINAINSSYVQVKIVCHIIHI